MIIYPELASGRADDFPLGPWRIREGSSLRGGASCNFSDRLLTIPLGPSEVDRVVRAHELAHTRISPHVAVAADFLDVHVRALECAEEYRINQLLQHLGFDVSLLCDGSERMGGARLAENGQWDEALCFLFAVLGTGAEKPYLAGIRSQQRLWVAPLLAVAKRVRSVMGTASPETFGATMRTPTGLPNGYLSYTVPMAKVITAAMQAQPPDSPEDLRRFRRSLAPGARRPPTGVFAPLVLAERSESLALRRRLIHRRTCPSVTGPVLRYPSRLLTQPEPKAFARKQRSVGGVILIDQSGSMDISTDQLCRLLEAAPDSLILGYSHRPGDLGSTPNAWVLANAAGVVSTPPAGNVGNGVDGPALEWALRLRRPGERLVWVSDGQVTDANDHPCDTLTLSCASLVRQHAIGLVRSLDQVESAFRGKRFPLDNFGRVGRALQHRG